MARYTFRDSDGDLNVFSVEHNDDGLWLNSNYGKPDNCWNPDNRFVFRARNSLHFSPLRRLADSGSLCLLTHLSVPAAKHSADFIQLLRMCQPKLPKQHKRDSAGI